ncbi:MAG: UDP-N-acetylmuramoyl-L-alanine--D-glutamate ligase [Ignavibacteria bacterium]|nr:UDP-N-acetylmuramoyl-L-alanine--D-glutamate ligase [Ignavibacteria bacterium]
MKTEEIKNTKFAVLGAGKSGVAITKLLLLHGAKGVLLADEKEVNKSAINIEAENLKIESGRFSDSLLDYDAIVKSPGIPPSNEILVKARNLGKEVFSEVEAASWFCSAPIIGITGTNGKTTTTVLIGEIFKDAGCKTFVCGNVGTAFSEIVGDVTKDSVVVLELSSFQLEDIDELNPVVSIILNITPDHIDWHGSFENYLNAKLKISQNHNENDLLVYNFDDETLRNSLKGYKGNIAGISVNQNLYETNFNAGAYLADGMLYYFDKSKNRFDDVVMRKDVYLKGNHNVYNALASIVAAKKFGISCDDIEKTLMSFKGVEHRIEFVREVNGVSYYNDSKATNIDALIVALQSFDKNIILILGGKDGGNDYNVVKDLVNDRVKEVIAVGSSKDKVYNFFNGFKKVHKVETYDEMVKYANEIGVTGDVVLLSPACKSFDMFNNFEERGQKFKELVNSL